MNKEKIFAFEDTAPSVQAVLTTNDTLWLIARYFDAEEQSKIFGSLCRKVRETYRCMISAGANRFPLNPLQYCIKIDDVCTIFDFLKTTVEDVDKVYHSFRAASLGLSRYPGPENISTSGSTFRTCFHTSAMYRNAGNLYDHHWEHLVNVIRDFRHSGIIHWFRSAKIHLQRNHQDFYESSSVIMDLVLQMKHLGNQLRHVLRERTVNCLKEDNVLFTSSDLRSLQKMNSPTMIDRNYHFLMEITSRGFQQQRNMQKETGYFLRTSPTIYPTPIDMGLNMSILTETSILWMIQTLTVDDLSMFPVLSSSREVIMIDD